jgi:hypothetical protein
MMMRSLGATLPPRPNAVAGTIHGTTAKAAVRFKNTRRERFEPPAGFVECLFFDMRSLLNLLDIYHLFLDVHEGPGLRHRGSSG